MYYSIGDVIILCMHVWGIVWSIETSKIAQLLNEISYFLVYELLLRQMCTCAQSKQCTRHR